MAHINMKQLNVSVDCTRAAQRCFFNLKPTRRPRVTLPRASLAEIDIASSAPVLDHLIQQLHSIDQQAIERLLHIADAAVAVAPDAADAASKTPDNGWLTPLVTSLETVLKYFQTGLEKYNVPYSYGWSIVALTATIKLLTLPLTKQQVESTMSMAKLKPEIDKIKEKYGEDKAAVQRETSALYEKAGVNPLAGCLPSIATIPVFIGLYRSLTSVAAEGALDNQGFYWIPSLAGPTTIAAQKAGSGTAWLLPFTNGAPPIGWEAATPYLILPVALVLAQYVSSAIISPPVDPNNDNAKQQKAIIALLPLMVGWFSLNVPSGLTLYYFSNTIFTSAQQIFLRKLGGANVSDFDLGPIDLGKARRTGAVAESYTSEEEDVNAQANGNGSVYSRSAAAADAEAVAMSAEFDATLNEEAAVAVVMPVINRRCKRKKQELLNA